MEDWELECIEDSEPERMAAEGEGGLGGLSRGSSNSDVPSAAPRPKRRSEEPIAVEEGETDREDAGETVQSGLSRSTSKYFGSAASLEGTKRRRQDDTGAPGSDSLPSPVTLDPSPAAPSARRSLPWDNAASLAAQAQLIAAEEARRLEMIAEEKKLAAKERRKQQRAPKSEFKSASTILRTLPDPAGPPSSSEYKPPLRMDPLAAARVLYGLPEVSVVKKAKETAPKSMAKGKGRQPPIKVEQMQTAVHTSDEEPTTADKLRSGLDKFKFGFVPSPSPSVSSSSASPSIVSVSTLTRKPKAPKKEKKLPTPFISLPPNELITSLASCPLCTTVFEAEKGVGPRSTHLKHCARENEYTAETVLVQVEHQVLALGLEAAQARRKWEADRTRFDMQVGRGEGANVNRELHVVGVESGGRDQVLEMQEELDKGKKRRGVSKVERVADGIKVSRREREEARRVEESERARREEDEYWAMSGDFEGEVVEERLPRPTGCVTGDSSRKRMDLTSRAGNVLARSAGTGLTQAPSIRVHIDDVAQPSSDDFAPPTQQFPQSKVARQFVAKGQGIAVEFPMKETQARALLAVATKSLWVAAGGKDPETISKVVVPIVDRSRETMAGRVEEELGAETMTISMRRVSLGSGGGDQGVVEDAEGEGGGDEGVLVWEGGGGGEQDAWRGDVASSGDEIEVVEVRTTTTATKKTRKTPTSSAATTATASATKPRSRSKSTRLLSSSPSSSDADIPPPPPNMPDYASQTVAALQREVVKFGFKVSKEKSVLVAQLAAVWDVMHPIVPLVKSKATRKKKVVIVQEETESVQERLRGLILGDDRLYMKVLRYEPISFDEMITLALSNGLKVSKPLLMRCLDEQSITFYIESATNGPRKRH